MNKYHGCSVDSDGFSLLSILRFVACRVIIAFMSFFCHEVAFTENRLLSISVETVCTRLSDDDDLSSSEDSEFSDLRTSDNTNENVITGKQEGISLDSGKSDIQAVRVIL